MEVVKLIAALRKSKGEVDGVVTVPVVFQSRNGRRCAIGSIILERDVEIVVQVADSPAVTKRPPTIVLYESPELED